MSENPYARYRDTATLTANPGRLVVMMYDGAIRACRTAQGALADRKVMPAHAALMQAQSILAELRQTLDMSRGELAQRLDQLYKYMQSRLVEANLRKESAPVAEVQALLEEVRGAWAQVARVQGASEGR